MTNKMIKLQIKYVIIVGKMITLFTNVNKKEKMFYHLQIALYAKSKVIYREIVSKMKKDYTHKEEDVMYVTV